MFLGPSRRKVQSSIARSALNEAQSIQLPFLCPILYRRPSRKRISTSHGETPVRSRKDVLRPAIFAEKFDLAAKRGLASATPEASPSDDFLPFDQPIQNAYSRPSDVATDEITRFPILKRQPPLILSDRPTSLSGRFRARDGISGDVNEMHQMLHASLQSSRWDRAQAILHRLNEIYKLDAPGLQAAHREYLNGLSWQIILTKDGQLLQKLLAWFEVEIRRRGIPQDAKIFATVIQACMQDPDDKRRLRAIKRYYKMARECGVENEAKELVPQLEASSNVITVVSP